MQISTNRELFDIIKWLYFHLIDHFLEARAESITLFFSFWEELNARKFAFEIF